MKSNTQDGKSSSSNKGFPTKPYLTEDFMKIIKLKA